MWPPWVTCCALTKARTVRPRRSRTAAVQANSRTSRAHPWTRLSACEQPALVTYTPPLHVADPILVHWASCGGGMPEQRCLWRASCSGWTLWRWWEWRGNHRSSTQPGCSQSTSSPCCPLCGWPSLPTTLCYPLLDLLCRTSLSLSFELLCLAHLVM